MIGYRITRAALETLIRAESADWLERAKTRTEQFRALGRYEETSSIWSEVKIVFMRLQGDCKCGYCERKLESTQFGKVEQDVEHFRPKGNIAAWKPSKALIDAKISFAPMPANKGGYYLLPYHIFNYSAACKPCNSVLKKDCFPAAKSYVLNGDDPAKLLKVEKPYLVFPVADFDDDPETIIRFQGASPQPVARSGYKRARALVTIEFFKLDDVDARKNLFRERALVILALYPQLTALTSGSAAEKTTAQQLVDGFTSPRAAHTNCARSFRALFQRNAAEAKAIFDKAAQFIVSIS